MASCSSCLMISICFSSSESSCITEVLAIVRDSAFPLVVKEAGVSLFTWGRGMSWCCWIVTSFCPSSVQIYFFRWQLPRLAVFHTACWLFPTWDLNRDVRVNMKSEPALVCMQPSPVSHPTGKIWCCCYELLRNIIPLSLELFLLRSTNHERKWPNFCDETRAETRTES